MQGPSSPRLRNPKKEVKRWLGLSEAAALSELRLAKQGLDFRRRDLLEAQKRLRTTQRRLGEACEAAFCCGLAL